MMTGKGKPHIWKYNGFWHCATEDQRLIWWCRTFIKNHAWMGLAPLYGGGDTMESAYNAWLRKQVRI